MDISASEITHCRICKAGKLLNIISLGNIALSYFINAHSIPPAFPLSLVLCQKCFLLQLKHTVPSRLLYTENYGYKSGINQTMRSELKEIVERALEKLTNVTKETIVVDIGANDGTLLKNYPASITRVGFEPVLKLAAICEKQCDKVFQNYFNAKAFIDVYGGKKASIVTAISCFYDMEEPNTFLKDVTSIMRKDGVLIIQQNYLVAMLKQNAFDNIVHEHLEYYSLLSLQNLLNRHGMEVYDIEENDLNGGSFRTFIAFKGEKIITSTVKKMQRKEEKLKLDQKEIYLKFAQRVKRNRKKLLHFVQKKVGQGKKIYLYGASTRGNTLIQYYNLDRSLITAAVERNPEKWGKRIASMQIPIISESKARENKPDYMLILPWFFKAEFLKREAEYLKSGGHFIFPLPKMEVI